MDALAATAEGEGLGAIRLETGIHQPEAIGLYRSGGYVEIRRLAITSRTRSASSWRRSCQLRCRNTRRRILTDRLRYRDCRRRRRVPG